MNVGERLRMLRQNAGYTQGYIAKKLNTTVQAIYKYEMNIVTNIPVDKINLLAEIYEVSPAYIMGWDNEKEFASDFSDLDNEFLQILATMSEQEKEWLLNVIKSVIDRRK